MREMLPPPDLVVALSATPMIIRSRLAARGRINIASSADGVLLEGYLEEWLQSLPAGNVLRLDVTEESPDYSRSARTVMERTRLTTKDTRGHQGL